MSKSDSPTPVVVTGVGLISALGDGPTSWRRLIQGESAIALRQPFPALQPCPLAMSGKVPSRLDDLVKSALYEALTDSGLKPPLNDCAVVLGSSRSYLAEWEALAQKARQAQTLDGWLAALPHQAALQAARTVQTSGPVLAPMAACATGLWAITQAAELIRTGQCQRAIAGAAEAPITPLTLAGFSKMGALSQTGCCPFDRARNGLVLGEGAAILVLESAELAAQRQAPIYGEILAAGLTNDAYHVSSTDPGYGGAIAAIGQSLKRSHLQPAQIDAVHTHGTGTRLNDQMEADLIAQIFGSKLPVMATKGATGHSLGASGALAVALSLLSLRHQQLLPCVGLRKAEFELSFVHQARPAALGHVLCLSFGFGGQNAAIALSRFQSRT
ncbi:beta-ketoacyl-ACP synthase [Romeria aff. gracilis LEGE 07310]|uniref:Beta-ketoacyl-ACP synthase n=1 Tax=Vasconcelosia minhoensis LEGE 07310 TaxID=915328 RepID=A0A8J7AFI8_9CYAN|nr:beta-ketoacyl-ACP synthase [Romeria gracilis]MBE9078341.1 beta-ketoacyl-ACP synthase [Romeria aff. gracilis LEGE 07310]